MNATKLLFAVLLFTIAVFCSGAPKRTPLLWRGRTVYGENAPQPTPEEILRASKQQLNANPFVNSGYFTVNQTVGAHMYYVFFEAQNGDKNAPVIMWLQGGPGCSSMSGLFLENGPYRVTSDLTLEENPYTWNKKYHMLFVDNPVGAGFSYVEKEEGYVTDEETMANNLYIFLTQFFTKYHQYQQNPFYVFGESYAGKYVPAIAYKIMKTGFKLNLKGIGVGDGLTHPIEQFNEYADFSYATGLINEAQKIQVLRWQQNVTKLIQSEQWLDAMDAIDNMSGNIIEWGGNVNVYDIREFGDYDFSDMIKYLALPQVKQMMNTVGHPYLDCGQKAYEYLYADMPQSVRYMVIELLDYGLPIILYNGQYDWIINNVGAERWINRTPWKGQTDYLNAKRTHWLVNGNVAGWHQQHKNLHQVIVVGAGHLSPMNQPLHLQDMVERFIENKPW